MAYDYTEHLAVDPATGQPVASAVFVFYPGGQDPVPGTELVVTDLSGVPVPVVTSTALGVVPPVRQADHPTMVIVSGGYQTTVVSVQGLITAAEAAVAAAQQALASAQSAAASAAQLAAASGIPGGGSTGQALLRAAGGATTWGTQAMTAAQVAFAPSGAVTATTVQDAVVQAAQTGAGSGTGQILTVQHGTSGYTVPSSRPAGVTMVWFRGPTQPLWDALPGWLGEVDCVYDWRA